MTPKVDIHAETPAKWQTLLGRAYGCLAEGRLHLYEKKWLKAKKLPARVICVGNLTVGGTGKTPMVIAIANHLHGAGHKTAVLSRGYRGAGRKPVNVVSDGNRILMECEAAGDEPFLMAESLPGVPVLTGPDRYRVGMHAIDRFGSEILVLDDGYQHIRLYRDVNILLLDARKPWGNGRVLPAGSLREPKTGASRATCFVLTRADEDAEKALHELERDFPGRPVFTARHKPVRLSSLNGGDAHPPEYLSGMKIGAFCGLAKPDAFKNTLTGLGADVRLFEAWPDHYNPVRGELEKFAKRALENDLAEVVATAKDAVKIRNRWAGPICDKIKVWVLEVEMAVDRPGELFDLIGRTTS